mgnify:CR=1 FL=1
MPKHARPARIGLPAGWTSSTRNAWRIARASASTVASACSMRWPVPKPRFDSRSNCSGRGPDLVHQRAVRLRAILPMVRPAVAGPAVRTGGVTKVRCRRKRKWGQSALSLCPVHWKVHFKAVAATRTSRRVRSVIIQTLQFMVCGPAGIGRYCRHRPVWLLGWRSPVPCAVVGRHLTVMPGPLAGRLQQGLSRRRQCARHRRYHCPAVFDTSRYIGDAALRPTSWY